ncbi:hypothetical protein OH799_26955 [Nocardia sp. NBC_00881]|uniref:hypothetical protein n=1 Tax=Nocardia sp. NBC_00881 TaxID=2975995 RepID=UPI00386B1F2E|nr:hypothetical protein OH799_26955 [Nocardia sp. NBC_00881]
MVSPPWGTGSAAVGAGSAGVDSVDVGSGGVTLVETRSAATGSAETCCASVGSVTVGSASPILLLPISPSKTSAPLLLAHHPPIISSAPDMAAPQISQILPPVLVLSRVQAPATISVPPPAAVPTPSGEPNHSVRPTAPDDWLPASGALSVIGVLIALGLAGAGSGAVSFQSASTTHAGIDAARAQFFPRP